MRSVDLMVIGGLIIIMGRVRFLEVRRAEDAQAVLATVLGLGIWLAGCAWLGVTL